MHASSSRLLRLFVERLEVSSAGFEMLGPTLDTQAAGQCHPVNACSPEVEMVMLQDKPSLEISLETVAVK